MEVLPKELLVDFLILLTHHQLDQKVVEVEVRGGQITLETLVDLVEEVLVFQEILIALLLEIGLLQHPEHQHQIKDFQVEQLHQVHPLTVVLVAVVVVALVEMLRELHLLTVLQVTEELEKQVSLLDQIMMV